MGEHYTVPEFTGLSCDTRQCDARKDSADPIPWSVYCTARNQFVNEAVAEGWTIWAGRTRRVYCPAHKPQQGHKMWLVSGLPQDRDA